MRAYLTIAVILLLNSCQGYVVPTYSESSDPLVDDTVRPVIVFAEGHNNFGDDRDSSNAEMEQFLAREGFELRQYMGEITREALQGVSILHTDNALAPEKQN